MDWTTESKGSEQKQVHSNQLTFIEEKIKIKILEPGVSVFKRNQCNKRSVDSCVLTLTYHLHHLVRASTVKQIHARMEYFSRIDCLHKFRLFNLSQSLRTKQSRFQ